MESGSMPYAEWHYPFEHQVEFKQGYPADYISEYTAQLRAWFYYLHALSNALFGTNCFKNVIVSGVILGEDGKKMSKSRHNYPDPKIVLEKYGGDALRLYLMGSPVMAGDDIIVTEQGIADQVRQILAPLWNCYRFLSSYARLHNWQPTEIKDSHQVLDRWVIDLVNQLTRDITDSFDEYNTPVVVSRLQIFINDLSNWYIRRSRDRFQEFDPDAYITLYRVLIRLCLVLAPLAPFTAEEIYRGLTAKESVHLEKWPSIPQYNTKLIKQMQLVREIVELGHRQRKEAGIKVRQPLLSITIHNSVFKIHNSFINLIKEELNIKLVLLKPGKGDLKVVLNTKITPELEEEGKTRDLIREVQELRKSKGLRLDQKINLVSPWLPTNPDLITSLKKKTLATEIGLGQSLTVK
jgi:isoleucyl-tRNA synthetase